MKIKIEQTETVMKHSENAMCQIPAGTQSVPVANDDLRRWYLANRRDDRRLAVNHGSCPWPPVYRFRMSQSGVTEPNGVRAVPLPSRVEFAMVEGIVECHWSKQDVYGTSC